MSHRCYLESLIEELQHLWHVGVLTHDNTKNETFTMRVALMWTVNNLPAYGMAFGWSTASVMGCPDHPYYRKKKAFTKNRVGKKVACPRLTGEEIHDWVAEFSPTIKVPLHSQPGYSSDHKWTKKSIFWELEYWGTHLIRHNLDVMHIEKNVFDNIFNIVMDIKRKIKDNLNARKDLNFIYNWPELEMHDRRPNVMPKIVHTLTKDHKRKM
ncbi:UNVERIFIED_CONTAM: hypothetical protein Slati_2148300 [Sesamum latifolium]|uniref:Uncharacterized protein n=1 Tax=Sesamum latifolium TaxID=2727402 RepID=A0AAW2WU53_9LAMI